MVKASANGVAANRQWQTERLLIRRFRQDDLEGLYELQRDPLATEFIGGVWTLEKTREMLPAIIASYEKSDLSWLAVTARRDGTFLGVCWIGPLSQKMCDAMGSGPHVELGYRYVRRHWGHGYATEAGHAMLRRGFVEVGLTQIVAVTYPENIASSRVLTKLGMTYASTFSADDRAIDLYELNRDDYLRRA